MSLYDNESESNLKKALESIFTQTLLPSEIVMVFDGPIRQQLLDIVVFYQSKLANFRIVRLVQNSGLGIALSFGLNYCNYDYVARMDTDDICYSERFEKQMTALMKNSMLSVLGTSIQEFNINSGDLKRYRQMPLDYVKIKKTAKYRNPLNHPTVIFKKADVVAVGSYQDMPLFEDYFLWIRLLNEGFVISNLDEPLLHFRVGNDMIGRRHGLNYLKKEFFFLKSIRNLGFINSSQFIISIILKLPVRLAPKKILELIYKIFLR